MESHWRSRIEHTAGISIVYHPSLSFATFFRKLSLFFAIASSCHGRSGRIERVLRFFRPYSPRQMRILSSFCSIKIGIAYGLGMASSTKLPIVPTGQP